MNRVATETHAWLPADGGQGRRGRTAGAQARSTRADVVITLAAVMASWVQSSLKTPNCTLIQHEWKSECLCGDSKGVLGTSEGQGCPSAVCVLVRMMTGHARTDGVSSVVLAFPLTSLLD